MTRHHQATVSTNTPRSPEIPLSLRFCATVCRNDCKLGMVLLEESLDVADDAPNDVQRFWKTVVRLLEPLDVDDTLLELEANA